MRIIAHNYANVNRFKLNRIPPADWPVRDYPVRVPTEKTALLPQCPQCERDDLVPYGNGSKWICPTCKFLAPCCEPDTACRW